MLRFATVPRSNLTNGQHFQYMTGFMELVKTIAEPHVRLQPLRDAFYAAQAEEDKYLRRATASPLTADIKAADDERDAAYSLLKQQTDLWAASGMEPQAPAAKTLQAVINTYRIDTKAQYDEQSGLTTNLITDLQADDKKTAIETLGLAPVVARLPAANEQVIRILQERDKANQNFVAGALRQARLATDRAYAAVAEFIEALNLVFDGTFDALIQQWNATTARYKTALARKGSTSESEEQTSGGGDSSNETIVTPA